jgi:RNA exonuclease NGL2
VKPRDGCPGRAFSLEASRAVPIPSGAQRSLLPDEDSFPHVDFNFSPAEPGYALLVGDALTPAQEELLERSRVVHVSVDPSVPLSNPAAATDDDDEGGAETADPDRVITNARNASPTDGLLSSSELVQLFAVARRPRSLYDEGQRLLEKISGPVQRCGERMGLPPHQRGAYEPEWTSYTYYWQSVLGRISPRIGSNLADQFFRRLHLGY